MQPRRSLVLLPYGMPQDEGHRELCTRLVLRAGGDIDRMIDQPVGDVERFGKYLARIPMLRSAGADVPIVFLTRTSPLPLTVLNARRVLETHVPTLRTAPWLLFVTDEDDPFFEDGARRLGALSGDLSSCPVWQAPHHGSFIVTCPATTNVDDVAKRIAQLAAPAEAADKQRSVTRRTGPDDALARSPTEGIAPDGRLTRGAGAGLRSASRPRARGRSRRSR